MANDWVTAELALAIEMIELERMIERLIGLGGLEAVIAKLNEALNELKRQA